MPGWGREVVLHQDRLAPYQPLAQPAAEAAAAIPIYYSRDIDPKSRRTGDQYPGGCRTLRAKDVTAEPLSGEQTWTKPD
ncbi:hypothetical protein AAFF_G00053350 [Aldrovandia affinis]|uniref:Uncharacterized protein n=1 Tax=Aldrovandia affinis TaxID=143900 RepID=A0AAD7WZ87_9TELE|nr:hypothetical protein AAFF_G00053350 [Aldrovandia affinis]